MENSRGTYIFCCPAQTLFSLSPNDEETTQSSSRTLHQRLPSKEEEDLLVRQLHRLITLFQGKCFITLFMKPFFIRSSFFFGMSPNIVRREAAKLPRFQLQYCLSFFCNTTTINMNERDGGKYYVEFPFGIITLVGTIPSSLLGKRVKNINPPLWVIHVYLRRVITYTFNN